MIPKTIRAGVEAALGTTIQTFTATSGGDINQAASIETNEGIAFLKWHRAPPAEMFLAEADGLARLADTEAVRVPTVLAVGDDWLLLEWLPIVRGRRTIAAARLGRQLAEMHRDTAETYGLERDNYIGLTPQYNGTYDDWVTFWRERRLLPQMKLAAEQGRLPDRRRRLLERLMARLTEWIPSHPPASLLHGDLWGGNWVILEGDAPALIDPAVYYGDRETDLAFTRLFGGFPDEFYAAYEEAWSLLAGHAERRDLYNIYHLLNHLNLFGGAYGASVDRILERYVG